MDATFQAYSEAKDFIHQKLFAWAVKTAERWYELPEGDRPDVEDYCYVSVMQCEFISTPWLQQLSAYSQRMQTTMRVTGCSAMMKMPTS